MQHILALSRSAVTIRHWFEINLDDSSMEHGARIEIRELARHPHRGSESASQLTTVDRPLWRADLFDRLADPPGSFSAAHYHPRFTGDEPSARFWDAALSSDPWTWLGDQIASLGTAAGGAGWPLDPGDAAELPGLASVVVATARLFAPAECRSAAECFQLTRDVQDAVQLMIATLRTPERLDRDRAAPWLVHSLRSHAENTFPALPVRTGENVFHALRSGAGGARVTEVRSRIPRVLPYRSNKLSSIVFIRHERGIHALSRGLPPRQQSFAQFGID